MILVSFPAATQAGMVSISAEGEYVMGDNDTATDGKALALEDAKRHILEMVGTYIESTTEVKNGIVTSDDVKQYTAGIVKMETIKEGRRLLENKATLIAVSVRASVDPEAVVRQVMALKNRTDVEEKAKRFSADNIRLREEIALMNQQLRQITDERRSQELMTQRKTALQKIIENEKSLTMLVSGESLVKMSLLDRQKKQDDLQIIKRFLSEVADAYQVSSQVPYVEDNGDGTSNVTINYSVNLPGNYSSMDSSSIYVPTNNEFLSKGFLIRNFPNGFLMISCDNDSNARCKNVLGYYFGDEVKKISLIIKMGNRVKTLSMGHTESVLVDVSPSIAAQKGRTSSRKRARWVSHTLYYPLPYKASFSSTFKDIRHDELKMISTIEFKILYDQGTTSPDKSQQTSAKKEEHSVNADQQYKELKGIVLKNGTVIEGQIISIDPDSVKIRTKEGKVLSYDFKNEVQRFITD